MKRLVLCLCLLSSTACAGKVTGATPVATAAITADAVVLRVNELQATVIDICGPTPTCAPGGIDTNTARKIVEACISARDTLKAVPSGWRATLREGWAQALPNLTTSNTAITAALAAVTIIIGKL